MRKKSYFLLTWGVSSNIIGLFKKKQKTRDLSIKAAPKRVYIFINVPRNQGGEIFVNVAAKRGFLRLPLGAVVVAERVFRGPEI